MDPRPREPGAHLAQVNVARLRAPLDAPALADFVAALAPVNALADGAPGFVWRLQEEGGDATSVPVFDDPGLIVNLSVWSSLDALRAFVYSGDHLALMRRRHEWFHRMAEAWQAMWWVPAGHLPDVAEAESRLLLLRGPGLHGGGVHLRPALRRRGAGDPHRRPHPAQPARTGRRRRGPLTGDDRGRAEPGPRPRPPAHR